MNNIKIWGLPSDKQLAEIADYIESGEIGVVPTDTCYAIVGDALNSKSVERICRLKGLNPDKVTLSIICSDISMAAEYARIDNRAFNLMKEYCPGPFTFLLKAASRLPKAFKSRKIVGVRIPDCDFDLALARVLDKPLITTSIQYDEDDYAISPGLIAENYEGKVDFMVEQEEGSTEVSTIVDCTGNEPEIVRLGVGIIEI